MSYKIESPLPVVEGGTGRQSNTPFAVLCGGVTATDQIQPIAGVGTAGQVLTSNGPGVLPTFQAGGGGGGGTTTFPTDSGTATQAGGILNIITGLSALNAGSTVLFSAPGSSNTVQLNVTDSLSNTIIGLQAGNGTLTGDNNTVLGETAAQDLTSGTDNTLIGFDAGASLTSGSFNVLLGSEAGSSYTSTENSNIAINASGTILDAHTLRIGGATGAGPGELNRAFVQGIFGITAASSVPVYINSSGQLGTLGGTSVASTFAGDTGSAVPLAGLINIVAAPLSEHAGSSVSFSGTGSTITLNVTDGIGNTMVGTGAGTFAMAGANNTSFGGGSLGSITTGVYNTGIGTNAGAQVLTGIGNTFLGGLAGSNYTGSESSNITIGYTNLGTVGESNVLRVGAGTGTGAGQLNQSFIHGIRGITPTVNDGIPVFINSLGQLGTVGTGGGGGASSFVTDSGTATEAAGAININAGNATQDCGSSVLFTGSGDDVVLHVTDANNNTIIGNNSGNAAIAGTFNVALGYACADVFTTGINNVFIGKDSGGIEGNRNICIGNLTGASLNASTANDNIIVGNSAGASITEGTRNVLLGTNAGTALNIGNDNIAIGGNAGLGLADGGNNILIGHNAGSSIQGDSQNIIIGGNAGANLNGGANNIIMGQNAGTLLNSGGSNILIGINAGLNLDAASNILIGNSAGVSLTGGTRNVLIGGSSGVSLSSSQVDNVFVGINTGNSILTGNRNTIIGSNSGTGYTGAESNNIIINSVGTAGNSNELVFGVGTGTGNFQLNKTFIHGIRGITTAVNDAVAVLVDSAGQLGTVSSSATLKHNIQDMDDASSAIMSLRPVTFAYNSDASEKTQYGLIAEEVAELFPDIVVYDADGLPQTIQYHILPALLLNELKKLSARVAELEAR